MSLSQAELHGVVPVSNGQFGALQQTAVRWSKRLKQAAAVCHGLTMINRSSVIGDAMELSLFKYVEASFKASVA